MKQWKCNICGYIHTGDQPPQVCPICGVGPEEFTLVKQTDEETARAALSKVSYGLYIVSTVLDGKTNGQCANTVFQLTSSPLKVAVCLNNRNLTTEMIKKSGALSISVLGQDNLSMVKVFGYQSGRTADKFADLKVVSGQNGCPILQESIAFLEAKVILAESVNVGTHMLFVCEVTSGQVVADQAALTYDYYLAHRN